MVTSRGKGDEGVNALKLRNWAMFRENKEKKPLPKKRKKT